MSLSTESSAEREVREDQHCHARREAARLRERAYDRAWRDPARVPELVRAVEVFTPGGLEPRRLHVCDNRGGRRV
jgi:hypothetical protein